MSTLAGQGGGLAVGIHGLLFLADRGGGLERHPDHDRFAVADAALDATGVVGGRLQPSIGGGHKGIVVFAAFEQGAAEARPDLEALGGGKGHHRLGQVRLQLVEDGHAQTRCGVAHHAFDHTATGVAVPSDRLDPFDHLSSCGGVRATNDVAFDRLQRHRLGIHCRLDGVDAFDPGQHFRACGLGQQLLGDRTGGHAPDRFPG